jgi:hypothetical protein
MRRTTRSGCLTSKLKIQMEIEKMKQNATMNRTVINTICEEVIDGKNQDPRNTSHSTHIELLKILDDNSKVNGDKLKFDESSFKLDLNANELKNFLTPKNFIKLMVSLKSKFSKMSAVLTDLKSKQAESEVQTSCMRKELQIKDILMQKYDVKLKSMENENRELSNRVSLLEGKVSEFKSKNDALGFLTSHVIDKYRKQE